MHEDVCSDHCFEKKNEITPAHTFHARGSRRFPRLVFFFGRREKIADWPKMPRDCHRNFKISFCGCTAVSRFVAFVAVFE